jgi:hypothetical protein
MHKNENHCGGQLSLRAWPDEHEQIEDMVFQSLIKAAHAMLWPLLMVVAQCGEHGEGEGAMCPGAQLG